ncbi:MAG TPA: hypothetical protein VHJ20_22995 [Polyangia bacterium]|nr:hypothetical protein [Polyangia bacterium]
MEAPTLPSTTDEPFGPASPWTGEARALLERAIERHGGWAAWRRFGGLSLTLESLTGLVPEKKGIGDSFPRPTRAEVWPHRERVTFDDFPAAGRRGVFSAGQVQIVSGATILEARADPRATFEGSRKARLWSPIDAVYFFGYALSHYHALPFSLVDGRPLGVRRARSAGRVLTGVEVALPASLATHSRRQTFFFDDDGLLRRHDYVAEIIGWWARGAHRWEDFVDVAGLPVARHRHVVLRIGAREVPSAVALDARFSRAEALPTSLRPKLSLV